MKYSMFDLNISIVPKCMETEAFLKDYMIETDNVPDISIEITDKEIFNEKQTDPDKSDAYHEIICIFRHLTEEIIDFDGMFIHSAVIEKDDTGFMFTGKSGVGKSTHIMNWMKYFGSEVKLINGDKPVIRFFGDGIYAYSNPWNGKEGLKGSGKTKLHAACFLGKAKDNNIKLLSDEEAFKLLLNQTVIPKLPKRKLKHFELLDNFIKNIDFYYMECDISKEAVMLSYNTMKGIV